MPGIAMRNWLVRLIGAAMRGFYAPGDAMADRTSLCPSAEPRIAPRERAPPCHNRRHAADRFARAARGDPRARLVPARPARGGPPRARPRAARGGPGLVRVRPRPLAARPAAPRRPPR